MPYKETDTVKLYYTIGEVSEMFEVNTSLIRFWEKEFDIIKPKKNKKGNRLFTPEDIDNFKVIYNLVKEQGLTLDGGDKLRPFEATYFLGREHIMASEKKGMAIWREQLFSVMSRNSQPATHFFQLPKHRVMEIGSMIEI